MKKKINLGMYSDEIRNIVIQYDNESFFMAHQDLEGLHETATEYSFEAFVKTYNFMSHFFNELALNDSEVSKKLFEMKNIKSKTKLTYV